MEGKRKSGCAGIFIKIKGYAKEKLTDNVDIRRHILSRISIYILQKVSPPPPLPTRLKNRFILSAKDIIKDNFENKRQILSSISIYQSEKGLYSNAKEAYLYKLNYRWTKEGLSPSSEMMQ